MIDDNIFLLLRKMPFANLSINDVPRESVTGKFRTVAIVTHMRLSLFFRPLTP